MREGSPLPERIKNAPQLHVGLELYYDAFFDLNTCRDLGMGVGPIPWTAMNDYAQAYGFDEEQRDCLMYFMREMDTAYLTHKNQKAPGWQTPSTPSTSGWRSGPSK